MISHFFIDRPIAASVVSIVIVILGLVSLAELPIAQYPDVAPPTVQVTATYPGANATTVANTVATPIEQEINGVEGMLYMSSKCTNDGQMMLDVTFKLGVDLNMAQVLVQNRVAVAEAKLPEEVKRIGVTTKKKSPSILLCVNLISTKKPDGSFFYDQLYLSNYATLNVKDELARIEGVGDVSFLGPRDYSMRVWLDPNRLAAKGLTASDVINAVREQNRQVAAGRLGQPPVPDASPIEFQLPINTRGRLTSEEEFENIVIKTSEKGAVVKLADVVREKKFDENGKAYNKGVEFGAKNYDVNSYLDGEPCVTIATFQLPGSNALETAKAIRKKMEELKSRFEEGIDYRVYYDTTVFIEESVASVVHTLIEAFILVFIVVLVFLQNWRATIIPMVAVPVSLIGTLGVMSMLGFSLNNLSLFGLVLAIGIVVDDAIVVVENVERWLAEGMSPRDASRKAMDEVTGPVIAISLVLCAVFVPTAITPGISGQFFRQFALTIAASTVISALNSLTLSPALCALMLKPHGHGKKNAFFRAFNWAFDRTINGYGRVVRMFLRLSVVALLVYGGLMGLTYVGFSVVPVGFIPEQDKGYLVLNAQLPDGASLERTNELILKVSKEVRNEPGVDHTIDLPGYSAVLSTNISNVGGMFIILKPFEERAGKPELAAPEIARRLRQKFAAINTGVVGVFGAPPVEGLGSTGGFKLQVQDRRSAGLRALQGSVTGLADEANRDPRLAGLFTSFSVTQPQLFVQPDEEKAKALKVPLKAIDEALQASLGAFYVNDFMFQNRNWQVNIQAAPEFRMQIEDIGNLEVRNDKGDRVPLNTLINVRYDSGPAIVNHYNLFPSAEINGNTAPGVSSGQAIDILNDVAGTQLPSTMGFEWTELTLQQILAAQDPKTKLVFPLAVVLVLLVLAFQYESWSLPISIILIVPMCLLAAIAGVHWAGLDNNIFTQIGLVVLVGLAAKNAILIVEFAKQLQDQGKPRFEATVEASMLRLRPILMTSFAFILGVVPLVLAKGAGAEMRVALGICVFSGMLGVTFFGIFFTPVFYVVIRWFTERGAATATPAATTDHKHE